MAEIAKIVLMRAKPDRVAELEAVLRDLLVASAAEEASMMGELHRSSEEEGLFMVYERWRDPAGFDAHMGTPHVAAFLAAAEDLLAEAPEVRSFDPLP